MRMWMIDPRLLCRQHLLGEHNELHKLAGCLLISKSIRGYLEKKELDPRSMSWRHLELVREMDRRRYNHRSPLPWLPKNLPAGDIDLELNVVELYKKCPECRRRMNSALKEKGR